MRAKKLLIQTIPVAGAITMSACGPARSSNSGGGGGSSDDIFGAWELRSYSNSYSGEEYDYPYSYTDYDGCTRTVSWFREVNEDGTGAFTQALEYSGDCGSDQNYSGPYAYSYPLSSQEIGDGIIRIYSDPVGTIDCPEAPLSSELECDRSDYDSTYVFRFEKTFAGNIPEGNVPVDGAE